MFPRMKVVLALAFAMLANDAVAHHNMTATFDFNDRVTLNGTLTKIDWRNPHTYLTIDVQGGAGATESWQAAGPSPTWIVKYVSQGASVPARRDLGLRALCAR